MLNQSVAADTEYDGMIHTRVKYLDSDFQFFDGGNKYKDNVTVVEISARVEIWNAGTQEQSVGYYWFASYCSNYLSVVTNITDTTEIYTGSPNYETTCSMTDRYYAPGLTVNNATVRLVFSSPNLDKLPSGEYHISAPTKFGIAYNTTIYSVNGTIEYAIDEVPSNWGSINPDSSIITTTICTGYPCDTDQSVSEKETDSDVLSLPVSNSTLVISIIMISVIRLFRIRRMH